MGSRGFALLELVVVAALVLVAAALVLRSGGNLAASEQAFVAQMAALVARAGQEAFSGYLPSEVVGAGGKVVLRLGGQTVDEVRVPPSFGTLSGVLVAYGPGGHLLSEGEVALQGRTGSWRLVVGEAGAGYKEEAR